ncbi:MAG: DUF11 domain-containing protein [Saprospiraceae bacterium]|nr:DUF11 domain-containing protein [Saprospiraceae bacterium]
MIPDIVVTADPSDDTICEGGTSSLSVSITGGAGDVTYQWQISTDGTNFSDITGATNATYTTEALTATTYYQVLVEASASGCEAATSAIATITVIEDLAITAQPIDDEICEGGTATVAVTVSGGAGTITYQWQSSTDGTNFSDITGANNDTYDEPDLSETTYYQVVIEASASDCDAVTSQVATVTVSPDIAITAQPTGADICIDGDAILNVEISGGSGTISYQWQSSANGTDWTPIAGATNSSYTASTDAAGTTYYRVVVDAADSGCESATSDAAIVIVQEDIAITTQPTGANVCTGGDALLTVAISGGSGDITYQWESSNNGTDWTPIAGATNSTYDAPTSAAGTTYYRVVVDAADGGCESSTSDQAIVVVVEDIVVTAQPVGADVCIDGDALLSVSITGGSGTITYQWESSSNGTDWTAISGATNDTYDAATSTAGTTYYRVVITAADGGCEANTSDEAIVNVAEDLVITAQPTSANLCIGGDALLSVTISGGSGDITYQWESSANGTDWTAIGGATADTYNAPTTTAGTTYYRVVIDAANDGCESVTSDPAEVIVQEDIAITAQPTDDSICTGGTSSLSVAISGGAGTISYQWESSASVTGPFTAISGATNATYLTDVLTSTTYYRVVVIGSASDCDAVTSAVAEVEVIDDLLVTAEPTDDSICEGGTTDLSVSVSGGAGIITYQWQEASNAAGPFADIAGATDANYSTPSLTSTTYYQVVISASASGCDPVTSAVAEVEVIDDLSITAQPTDDSICEGGTSTLSVAISGGAGNVDYQWQIADNAAGPFADITGATNATYVTEALTANTYYQVVITAGASGCDPVTSTVAEVEVIDDIEITAQPADDEICQGGTTTLAIAVSGGSGVVSYQWQIADSETGPWTDIAGATADSYTTDILNNTTYYQVVITASGSGCDAVTSTVATVTVVVDPTIVAQPQSQTICEGSNIILEVEAVGGTPFLTYQWQTADSPAGPWADIDGATNTTYTTPILTEEAYYQVIVDASGESCSSTTSDVVTVGVNPLVIVSVGEDAESCSNAGFQLEGEITGGIGTGTWTTTGDGTFDDDRALDAIYTPGPEDIAAGTVNIILTSDDPDGDGPCISETDFLVLTINLAPEITSTDLTPVSCEGDNGSITITVEGGTAPYIITWSNGDVGLTATDLEPGSHTVTIVDDKGCIIESTIELVKECFDLALTKELISAGPFFPGDAVTFQISVTNQGNIEATDVEITDYIPSSLILTDGAWAGDGTTTIPSIASGATETVTISFQIDPSYSGGNIVNYAEISEATNALGLIDEDSNFDQDNTNDAGGEPESPADNYINGDGTGAIGSGDADGDEDDHDPALIFVEALVDLELDKTVDNATPFVGSRVVFTITVENKGPSTATGVTILDYLPAGYDDVQFISFDGDAFVQTISGNIIWRPGDIDADEAVTLVFSALVVEAAETAYDNSAEVLSLDQEDIDSEPNNDVDTDGDGDCSDDPGDEDDADCVEVDPIKLIDLELDKSVSNETPDVGTNIVYTISVTNQGPSTASGVIVTDLLPSGLTFVSSDAGADYNSTTGAWNAGTIGIGETVELNITAFVEPDGDYVNLAEVTDANEEDVDSTPDNGVDTNNNGEVSDDPGDEDDGDGVIIDPVPIIDLELDKSVDDINGNVDAGEEVTFTVELTNQGPSTANGVEVTDQLEDGFIYLSHNASVGTYDPISGEWEVGTLLAGETVTLDIRVEVNVAGNYFNLAEVTDADEEDSDSTPGNGVDTDGDGDFTDDFGDEDDGDGVIVDVDCDMIGNVANIYCDDSGTPLDPDDDVFFVEVVAQGFGTGTSPGWRAEVDGETVGTGDYSGAVVTVGPFLISNGDVTIYIIDDTDSGCRAILRGEAPEPCSLRPCDLVANITDVVCDDNSTGADPDDDVFYVSVSVAGSNNNSWSAKVNGEIRLSALNYNRNETLGPFFYSAGAVEIEVFDDEVGDCTETFVVNPPDNTCSSDCSVIAVLAQDPVCNDNGTPGDPSDDTYSFSLLVNGNNTSGTTWKDNFGNIGTFGEVRTYTGFQIAEGPFTMTISDENNTICRTDILIIPPAPCSNTCDIRPSVIIEPVCSDNGTPSNPNDDVFSFTVEVEGDLVGNNGWEALVGGVVVATGNYGDLIQVGPLAIVNGDVQVIFRDVDDQNCTEAMLVQAPLNCSSECQVVVTQPDAVDCDPAGTPADPTDDTFSFQLDIDGNNGSGRWRALIDGVEVDNGSYGTSGNFGPYLIANGPIEVVIEDELNPDCGTSIIIDPPSSCSEECSVEATLENTICSNNGTPFDPSDDLFYAAVRVDGFNTGARWTTPQDFQQGTDYAYGATVLFGPYPISAGNRVINFFDLSNGECAGSIFITAPEDCSRECLIDAVVGEITCDDQGTSDPSDDTFTVPVTINGQYNFGSCWRELDGTGQTGNYGETVEFGPYLVSDGDVSIKIADCQDISCQVIIVTPAPEACSQPDCEVAGDVQEVTCDDNGTPADPTDDVFFVTMDISVEYSDAGAAWRATLLDGTAIGTGTFPTTHTFGPLSIPDPLQEIGIIIEDVIDATCRDTIFVLPPTSCSEACAFDILADAEGICNDNGTPSDPSDDTYSFTMTVNGTNGGNSGWQASIDGVVRAIGTYGSTMTIDDLPIGTDVTIVVNDIDDPECGVEEIIVTSPESCSDACGITQVLVSDPVCTSSNTYNFTITVEGVGEGWETADGTFSGPYNTEVTFPDQVADGTLQRFTIIDTADRSCTATFEVQAPEEEQCSQCDVQVLMPDLRCDDNGTPNDPSDDVYYFDMVFTSTALAGSSWTAEDPNATTGTFGDNVITFGPYSIQEEGAVSFLVISDVNPNCQVAVFVPAPEACSAGCRIDAEMVEVVCNDNGTVNDREDDVFITSLRFTGEIEGSIGWNVYLLDSASTWMGTGLYNTERFFGPFSANDGPVTFVVEDLMSPGCRDTITIDPAATCSPALCDIRAVVESTNCSDNGTPDDPTDDFFTVDVRVEDEEGSAEGWVASNDSTGLYGEVVTFGPYSFEQDTYLVTFRDSLIEDCEFELTIKRPLPEVTCPEDVETIVGSTGEGEDLVCTDLDQIVNNPASLDLTGRPTFESACGVADITFQDEVIGGDCDDVVILRTFTINLISGDQLTCEQRITVRKAEVVDVTFPGAADFVCTDQFLVDENGHPHPDVTGYPIVETAFGQHVMNPDYCNLTASYQDQVDPGCGGASEITRFWTITDNCTGETTTQTQLLTITGDDAIPSITCPEGYDAGVLFSTDPGICSATIEIPTPRFDEVGCAAAWQLRTVINDSEGNTLFTIENGEDRTLEGITIGDYEIQYTVFDDCGATTTTSCFFSVADLEKPQAVCEPGVNISLGGIGVARLFVANIDAGSFDNCAIETIEVRRIYTRDPETCDSLATETYTDWGPFIEVSCCDAGQFVTVELRVTDASGNVDVCSVQVLVEDKTLPYCYGLEDDIVSCDDLPDGFDPYNSNQMADLFGMPLVEDNCAAEAVELDPEVSLDDCGFGYIIRRFVAVDVVGNVSEAIFEQQIIFDYSLNYEIGFPRDTETNCIFDVDTLIVQKTGCDSITVTYEDVFLPLEGAECYNLVRTYHVINHCEWDGISAPVQISRDEDCDGTEGEERVWVLVRPDGTFVDSDNDEINRSPLAGTKDASCDGTSNPEGYWRTLTSNGYWTYSQRIKMYDNIPAAVSYTPAEVFCTETAECETEVTYPFSVIENCLPENLEIRVFLDLDSDGVLDGEITEDALLGEYPNFEINGVYPLGKHQFRLDIVDGCGNSSTENIRFEVIDCYVPDPHCLNGLILDIEQLPQAVDVDNDGDLDDFGARVFAAELANCDEADCTPGLRFSVNRVGVAPDINQSSLVLTCDDGAIVELEVYVWDSADNPQAVQPDGSIGGPNYKFCTVEVLLRDNTDLCSTCEDDMLIAGDIYTEDGEMIEGVEVRLEGGMSAQSMTERSGHFEFVGMLEGEEYTIEPFKDGDDRNGITTLDILLIQRHLLGVQHLDSPYKVIAADVNGSRTVTTLDLLLIRALLLGNIEEIPNNTSWRFVDARHEFTNPLNPWADGLPESITTGLLNNCMSNANFIGIKIGDVNATARLTQLIEIDDRNTNGKFGFNLKDKMLQEGQTYTIDFMTDELREILGYQFALNFDTRAIEVLGADYEMADVEHFGWNYVQQGILTTSWNHQITDPQQFESNGNVRMFSLEIKAKRSGRLSDLIAVSSRMLQAEAYDLDQQLLDVEFRFIEDQPLPIEEVANLQLFQNKPNPFDNRTAIEFIIPAASDVTFTIHDMNGKVLHMTKRYYEKGQHQLIVERENLPAGLMYYTVSTDKETRTKKMILL